MCCWHTIPQLRSVIIPVRGIRPWEEREKNVISHPGLVCYHGALTAWNVLVQGGLDNALQNGYFSWRILFLISMADASVLAYTRPRCLGSRFPLNHHPWAFAASSNASRGSSTPLSALFSWVALDAMICFTRGFVPGIPTCCTNKDLAARESGLIHQQSRKWGMTTVFCFDCFVFFLKENNICNVSHGCTSAPAWITVPPPPTNSQVKVSYILE